VPYNSENGTFCCCRLRTATMRKAHAKTSADSPVHASGDRSAEFPTSLLDCSRRMFLRQDGCDVTFVVKGPGDASETKIGAHRYVLCSRSPVFCKTLNWGSKAPPDKKLKENDFSAETFREILRFADVFHVIGALAWVCFCGVGLRTLSFLYAVLGKS